MVKRHPYKRVYDWSADIAYSVGLMASDGCLSKDGRHLDLTSIDIEQLINFNNALRKKRYIGTKLTGHGSSAYRVQFGDVAYYDFLVSVGLTVAKSHTIGPLNIPDSFYADFLRGLFDGDGSTYAYMDKRWHSSYMYYLEFTSASKLFLNYLQTTNSRLCGVSSGSISVSKRAETLRYAKADAKQLARFMYYSAGCISLTRKRIKLAGFIETDRNVTIARDARVAKPGNRASMRG